VGQSVAERLFALLREEAGEDSFARLAEQAAGAGVSPASPEPVGHLVALALQIRRRLADSRRRAAELVALYETAHDLTALRDIEKVLQAIVDRSQQLLSADVAYLMLIDEERGDTYMRCTKGTVTPGFGDIRLPLGFGLGGLVAQTATPYATVDYTKDERFVHVIDDIVTEERLTAILGVPLKIGRRVIGVLFAADRHPRHFAPEEISLLASLAAHATVAIENASLFQGARSAIEQLTGANTLLQAQKAAVERASELHERLTRLVLRGTSVAELASSVVEVLEGRLLVFDEAGRLLSHSVGAPARAGAAPFDVPAALPRPYADALAESLGSGRSVQLDPAQPPGWVTPVVAGGNHLATLVWLRADIDNTDLRALERAAMVTALLLLNERAMDEANNRIRGEILAEALVRPVRDPDGLRRRAALIGVDLTAPNVLAVVGLTGTARDRRPRVVAQAMAIARSAHGLVSSRGDRIVMLVPGTDPDAVAARLAQRLGAATGCPVTVGGAGPVSDPAAIARVEQTARKCMAVLLAIGRAGEGAGSHRLGAYGLLVNGVGSTDIDHFVEHTLGPVLAYDRTRHTELLRTMAAYLAAGGNVRGAAAELFLHVNTLYQRLERLDEVLGPDWRTGDHLLQVHLALKLRQLRDHAPAEPDNTEGDWLGGNWPDGSWPTGEPEGNGQTSAGNDPGAGGRGTAGDRGAGGRGADGQAHTGYPEAV
jgi:DNA-binding PucR family transcriptional regulator